MNVTDIIRSPRTVAGGQGAWTGTLAELIERTERYDEQRAADLVTKMIADGRIPAVDEDADERTLADVAHLITLDDVQDLTDDPNAIVIAGDPPRATDQDALRRAIAYWPMTVERAQHALTAFHVPGTVTACERFGGSHTVADASTYVPSSRDTDSYALRLSDGDMLVLLLEADVAGGADASVYVTVTLIGSDGQTLGSDGQEV